MNNWINIGFVEIKLLCCFSQKCTECFLRFWPFLLPLHTNSVVSLSSPIWLWFYVNVLRAPNWQYRHLSWQKKNKRSANVSVCIYVRVYQCMINSIVYALSVCAEEGAIMVWTLVIECHIPTCLHLPPPPAPAPLPSSHCTPRFASLHQVY